MSFNWNDGVPLVGIGLLGLVSEFIISEQMELFPVILFCLVIFKGLESGLRRR